MTSMIPYEKCSNCKEYYGCQENDFKCSVCAINPKLHPIFPKVRKIKVVDEELLKSIGFEAFPDKIFKLIYLVFNQSQYKYDIKIKEQFLKQLRSDMDINYMFSDKQALKLINYAEQKNNYTEHQFIVRNKLFPWSQNDLGVYHRSAYCYYGNFGEVPEYMDAIKIV